MKKRTKTWLIAGLLLILAGAALCAGVLALNHWGLRGLFTMELETRTVELREEIHSIAVTADTEQLRLLPGDDGGCRVIFKEGERQRHTAQVEDGNMRILLDDEQFAGVIKAGLTVKVGDTESRITSIGVSPSGTTFATAETTLTDGSYPAKIVLRRTQVLSLLFN